MTSGKKTVSAQSLLNLFRDLFIFFSDRLIGFTVVWNWLREFSSWDPQGILSAEKKQEAPGSGLDHSLRSVPPELYKWELRCKDAESNSRENKEPC